MSREVTCPNCGSQLRTQGEALVCPDQLVRRSLPQLKELSRWSNKLAGKLIGYGTINALAGGPDRVVALTRSGHLAVFNRADQAVLSLSPISLGATALDVTRSQSLAAYGSAEGNLTLVELQEEGGVWELESAPHLDFVTSVAFSHDEQLLASASRDRTIRLWSVGDGRISPILKLELSRVPRRIRFTPSGDLIALLHKECGLRVWRMAELRERLGELKFDW